MRLSYYKKQSYTNKSITIKSHRRLILHWAKKIPSFLIVAFISVYQFTLSPDHGIVSLFVLGQCKYRPTCSEYTKKAVVELGAVRGLKKGCGQILRCH